MNPAPQAPARTPWWLWLVIPSLASLQPAAHLIARYAPPQGMVPTGLHVPDSAIFLQSMRMFSSGFHSPYATCHSPLGSHDPAFFPMPHQWFYGLQGLLADAAGIDPSLLYALVNGLAAALFLTAVYVFMRTIAPQWANTAFLLYALGGGLGGVLYLATGAAGLHASPAFETYFSRFALYELLEGARLFPATFYARSYYTLSLALCLASLTLFHRALQNQSEPLLLASGLPLLAGAFLNLRFGAFTAGILFLYLLNRSEVPLAARARKALLFLLPGLLGWAAGWLLMRTSPTAIRNHLDTGGMNLWFSPLLSCVALYLPIVPAELWRRATAMPLPARGLAMAALGYLAAFTALFIAYQAYWGNLLVARDAAVAVAISDWALLGALAGGLWALRSRAAPRETSPHDWIVLWTLAFTVIALSAWGRGWFLRFGPQRMVLMLYLPWTLIAAAALERLARKGPRLSRTLTAAILVCGIASLLVSTFLFQSPLGRRPEAQAFDWTHTEVITEDDDALIARIEAGRRVLAPAPMADVIAYRQPNPVVFGIGAFNMSDMPHAALDNGTRHFFSPAADNAFRRSFVQRWCVEYIYCPGTWPVDETAVEELRTAPWLFEIGTLGRASLFEVFLDPRDT